MTQKSQSQEPENDGQQGTGSSTEPLFLVIGRVERPHGIRGEMRVSVHTELPERYSWLDEVYLSLDPEDPEPVSTPVANVRFHKGGVLLTLGGTDDRDKAEQLRGYWLLVPATEAIPLEEGEVYLYQLEGLAVHTDEGEYLGEIAEVLETGANEVFVVQGPRGEILLPNTEEVVREVDMDERRITVHLLEGLL